ncbi:MAG: fructose-specific PTS transporter subunit EIIC [Peptostreptococcaceae bacterium]|nr:fructose-specific PTS transporter subunit EIIC [Peptostreptococcaceae bacterium]
MKITELLSKNSINLRLPNGNKMEIIDALLELMYRTGNISDEKQFKDAILAREEQFSTGIGEGIAIPHGKSSSVKQATLVAGLHPDGVDYDSLDGQPSKLFFMIAAPEGENQLHLDVLARLSTLLMDENFKNKLLAAKTADEFLKIIDDGEREKYPDEYDAPVEISAPSKYSILAVTACPTGIAHTYMAAQKLEDVAKELGISLKVETNGSGGVKNKLSAEEIAAADAIIVAADTAVQMGRFDGKRVLKTGVTDGIHKAKELLEKAPSAPIYISDEKVPQSDEQSAKSIYKHLMNGVSNMLPFVIGGGILIALAFLFDDYAIDPSKFGSNTPLAKFFMDAGSTAFGFMLPVLAGFIAMSIGDRPALAVGFVGGALANAGGSGFLGALLAGFIAGYLVLLLKKIFSKLPDALEGIKPVLLYPVCGILLIALLIIFVVNPPVSAINAALNGFLQNMGTSSRVLLGILLGGMMAVDMGGPINKAAYVFGTASIESGNFEIMAAVMAGGMVPPLAIAIATTFFKSKFTKKERRSAITNYIMGMSFITEGAIPFAAADPIRVLPACIIGSGIAGALSMFFGCTLRAPHGGLFVLATIGNAPMYLLSIIIGSVVGAILLGLLKKKVEE